MAKEDLPLIPLSPLIQSSMVCAAHLAQASKAMLESETSRDLSVRLLEQCQKKRQELDQMTRQMQSIQTALALHFDAPTLAKQIAIIDSQLFACVKPVLGTTIITTPIQRMIDFHQYLIHSFAHQLIYFHTQKCVLAAHFVQVAYILLHCYRDFSASAAIMHAFMLESVQRLDVFEHCSDRIRLLYDELTAVLIKQDGRYLHTLRNMLQHLLSYHEQELDKPQIIAIPYIQAHLRLVDLEQDTTALSLIEACRHSVTNAKELEPITVEGIEYPIAPASHLQELQPGDLLAHHWLISRVYLTAEQLMMESLEILPASSSKAPSEVAIPDDNNPITTSQALDHVIPQDVPTGNTTATTGIEENGQDQAEVLEQLEVSQQPKPSEVSVEPVISEELVVSKQPEILEGSEVSEQPETLDQSDIPGQDSGAKKVPSSLENNPESVCSNIDKAVVEISSIASIENVAQQEEHPTASAQSNHDEEPEEKIIESQEREMTMSFVAEDNESAEKDNEESEIWHGYPTPQYTQNEDADDRSNDEDEVWKGYPTPVDVPSSPVVQRSPSHASEEWKGYHATSEEAQWQAEINLKVQQQEWLGYALGALDEDESLQQLSVT
ncbi:uncharacterized protein BYT42DRAFT_576254 [Radiomyces spectabilis]|uniref:uncharacterized protein n=1 Tax=Radiomyces spectabilis TaxID=64574 RepID=UPI00221F852C|nr:uncharacterized protein BYT42DRAFT_576254 [Radiomyces spectabilis]KAI8374406.1 hypothetical protein BYT42DRAFT_576254 [Radiomyces spectabilis]